jgi:hypothetical protein
MDHFLGESRFNMMHLIIVRSVPFGLLGILEAYSFRFSTIHALKLTFFLSTVGAFIWLALVICSFLVLPVFHVLIVLVVSILFGNVVRIIVTKLSGGNDLFSPEQSDQLQYDANITSQLAGMEDQF